MRQKSASCSPWKKLFNMAFKSLEFFYQLMPLNSQHTPETQTCETFSVTSWSELHHSALSLFLCSQNGLIDKVLRMEPGPTSSQRSQRSLVRCLQQSWRYRPGPGSVGTLQRVGTVHRVAGRGGRQPSASSAFQTACWPQTGGFHPVGRPSLEFYLRGGRGQGVPL